MDDYENQKRMQFPTSKLRRHQQQCDSGPYSEPRTDEHIRKSVLKNLHLTSMLYTDTAKSNLQNWMSQLAASTSQPGIKYVIEEKGILRYLWGILLIALFAIFTWQFMDSVLAFHQNESYTSVEYRNMVNLTLPAVTICNVNSARRSTVEQIEPQLVDLLLAFTKLGLGFIRSEDVERLYNQTVNNTLSQFTFLEFLSTVGHQLPDMFIRCALSQRSVPCAEYLTPTATNIGICYTFNSQEMIEKTGVVETSEEPGPFDGINLTIDIEPHEYLVTNGLGEGVVVNIHPPETHPFIHSNSIFLPPGEESFIQLKMVDRTVLSTPYSKRKCVRSEDLQEKSEQLFGFKVAYSEDVCRLVCFVSNVYGCDGCNPLSVNTSACSMWQAFRCAVNNFHRVNQYQDCDCPPTCQHTQYDYQVFHTKFPNAFAVNALQNYMNSTTLEGQPDIKQRLMQLHIYYDSNTYTKTEQRPVTNLFLLLSNVGGSMGLYMGTSLVTLLEFIYLFVIFIYHKCFKN